MNFLMLSFYFIKNFLVANLKMPQSSSFGHLPIFTKTAKYLFRSSTLISRIRYNKYVILVNFINSIEMSVLI